MNKKLLAVAIGAALTAPMYAAHAAVTVGGQAHVSADYVDTFEPATPGSTVLTSNSKKLWNISSNVSNIFFKADEDLGGGMKGVFFLQEYFRLDNNGGTTATYPYFGNRIFDAPAYAGLSSSFGTVLLGNQDGPVKMTGRYVDLFNNQIGDSRNAGADNTRFQNSITYTTPTFFGGLSGVLAHATNLDNVIASTGAGTDVAVGGPTPPIIPVPVALGGSISGDAVGVKWDQGPLMVAAAYHQAIMHASGLPATYADNKVMDLSASFKFGAARIVGFYQQAKNVLNTNFASPTVGTFVDGLDKDTYGIGASFTFGGTETIKAQYYNVTNKAPGKTDINSQVYALGYDHAFSKTFTGYLAVAASSNDSSTATSAGGNNVSMSGGGGHGDAVPVAAGQSQSGLSLGIIYNF